MPARTRLDYGCLLFIPPQKPTTQKNPNTHVFTSHMAVTIYNSTCQRFHSDTFPLIRASHHEHQRITYYQGCTTTGDLLVG
jgi:hypothetical protein